MNETLDHLFRRYSGQMISVLCRSFGFEKIDLVEDAVQDALVAAMKTWPFAGEPEHKQAWLMRTARNRCIDILRRNNKLDAIDDRESNGPGDIENFSEIYFENEIGEDQLRMMFACCHPAVAMDAQVALTLKAVSGFTVDEIARSYLSNRETIAKMITRAKNKLREVKVQLDLPGAKDLPDRSTAVHRTLYLMFNEGYGASHGEVLIKKDLAIEAIMLTESMAAHPVTASPVTDALAALFLFQGSRISSRSDQYHEQILFEDQDRSRWDTGMIGRALCYLRRSASGDVLSDYHIEAEIAGLYTLSSDYATTNWQRILACYDILQQRNYSPIVELNRLIVLTKIEGWRSVRPRFEALQTDPSIQNYNLFYITQAHFFATNNSRELALISYEKALSLTRNGAVSRFIGMKIEFLQS